MTVVGSNRNRPKAASSIEPSHRLPLKTTYGLEQDQYGEQELNNELIDSKGALSITNLNIMSE